MNVVAVPRPAGEDPRASHEALLWIALDEQHLRAVLDWPLGQTGSTAPAVVTVDIVAVGRDGTRRLYQAQFAGRESRAGTSAS